MIAIHNLDNSIEYILRIIIRHVDFEDITGKNLETCELGQLAGEINKFLKEKYSIELPYLSEIKLLRQLRNLVQHAMVDPATDISRFINISQRFFNKVMSSKFDTRYSEIKLSNLITNSHLKQFLLTAEELIEQKKYIEAIVACRDAFENAMSLKDLESTQDYLINLMITCHTFLLNIKQIIRKCINAKTLD
ncbi:hypothetical protein [Paenibacillus sp. 7516]|uniref:hypothetical protein n=1 Tax=Paenibacillus sp. 7516 TaxID=2022549 RepID=UPI000BA61F4A|nr:hypothetical protein [Paenibacillus sp. 7516]PAF30892.1 hypothetical protein CHI14_15310 [Paenibacillus sp. 7516]